MVKGCGFGCGENRSIMIKQTSTAKPEKAEKAEKPKARRCVYCGRALPTIGWAHRRGGTKRHADWAGRKYHKACWKLLHLSSLW